MKQIFVDSDQIVLCEIRAEPRINILFDVLTSPKKIQAIAVLEETSNSYLVLDGNNRALAYKCLNRKAKVLVIGLKDYLPDKSADLNLAIPQTKYAPFNKFEDGIDFLNQAKVTSQEIKKIIDDFKIYIKNYYNHYLGLSEEQKRRIKTVMTAMGVE